jgi:UDP-N-acetyl-D-glucosamine dehydrogenase
MPEYVVHRVAGALNDQGKPMRESKILVIGLAYKPNVDDVRESPAAEIIELLQHRGCAVQYHDPHVPKVPKMREYRLDLESQALKSTTVRGYDCILIVTDHDAVDYELIGKHAQLVVDTRNAMARVEAPKAVVVKA